jgi:diguanylate cyclase (GGDEF)-like protein
MRFPIGVAWRSLRLGTPAHGRAIEVGTPGAPDPIMEAFQRASRVSTRRFHALVGVAMAIVAAAVLALGLTILGLLNDATESTSRDAGHIATILAEQIAHSVKAIDESLTGIQNHLVALQEASPQHFHAAVRSLELHQILADRIAGLPQANIFAIVSPEGHTITDSKVWPATDIDVSDREYFAVQRTGAQRGLYVSPLLTSRGDKTKLLIFSRRVESRQGEFLGIVVIGIPIDYFQHIYNAIGSLADLSFLFLRTDGTILVRYPDATDRAGEKMPPGSAWYAAAARGEGYYLSQSIFDNEARFIAVRKVPDYPFVVNAAESESAALAPWRRRSTMIAAGAALSLICFAFLLRALYAQFRNLSASQISLAERESRLSEQSRELACANTQIDAALNNMSQGLSMYDSAGQLVICNARYLDIYQMPSETAKSGMKYVDVLKWNQRAGNFDGDPERYAEDLCARLAQGQKIHTTVQLADGRVIDVANEPMIDGGWVATHDDITERQRSEARIARMARHDALTDLANRALFREKADEALEHFKETGIGYSVLIFDLDLFKSVNDSLGHPIGDALLKAVATRLQEMTSETDTVGRLGGDEFAILHGAEANQREGTTNLARRLLEVISAPYQIDGHRIVIGTSIGIAMAPDHGLDAEGLLKNADLALYRAKSEGRNSYRFFEPEMDRQLRLRRALEVDLQNAVNNDEFEAHYQPLVNADDGETSAVEALIRWRHPRHGIITPDRFISVAEECGMIPAIGRWMLRRACRDAVQWPDHIRVAVNLSSVEFRAGDLLEKIAEALSDSGLAPERLELEITESVLLQEDARNIAILHQMKDLGVSIVLDDFGTGYSSLGYLRLFPFDKIKIDQSFVREMPYRSDCAAIVCAIVNLGRELNIVTTAEGVETREQLDLVRAAGCQQVQGFLFNRPSPVSQLMFTRRKVLTLRQPSSA